MRRKFRKLYFGWLRKTTGVAHAAPAVLAQRLSYILDTRRIYRALPGFLRLRFWCIMLLQFVRSIIESMTIFVIAMFTQSVASPDSLRARSLYRLIVPHLPDYVIFRLSGDRTLITTMCLMVMLFIILKNLVVYLSRAYSTVFSENVGIYINKEAFGRYFAKDYLWHISPESKAMMERINFRGQLTTHIASLLQLFGSALCAVVMFGFLFLINPRLTAVVIGIFAVVCIVAYALLRVKIDRAGTEVGRIASKQGWAIKMATRGIREIIIYRKQNVFLNSILDSFREAVPHKTFLSFSGNIPGWLLEVTGFVIIFGVMYYMVHSGMPMPEIIGSMSMLLLTAWRVLPMVSRSMGLAVRIRGIRSRAIACLELLESFDPQWVEEPTSADPNFHLAESIELRDAAFAYPGAKHNCLAGINLLIRKGERIGIVGRSGAGKSTLGMILAGLFLPVTGTMAVDGVDMVSGILDSYRQRVGYVPQNPLLLPGTVADNIALSQWGDEYDRTTIARVSEMAAMDFAAMGRGGIRIGEGGEGLSGGEAQRVSIARALFSSPEILIFDEATSSLDTINEARISETLLAMGRRVTLVVIAHRLSTVENCDKIVWMEKGKIREIGPPSVVLPRFSEK